MEKYEADIRDALTDIAKALGRISGQLDALTSRLAEHDDRLDTLSEVLAEQSELAEDLLSLICDEEGGHAGSIWEDIDCGGGKE